MIRLLFLLLPMTLTAQSKYTLLPDSTVTGIDYQDVKRWATNRFSARWNWGKKGVAFTTEMSLGGAEPTLQDIENRVLSALKPDLPTKP